jgi:hypothetical protein
MEETKWVFNQSWDNYISEDGKRFRKEPYKPNNALDTWVNEVLQGSKREILVIYRRRSGEPFGMSVWASGLVESMEVCRTTNLKKTGEGKRLRVVECCNDQLLDVAKSDTPTIIIACGGNIPWDVLEERVPKYLPQFKLVEIKERMWECP